MLPPLVGRQTSRRRLVSKRAIQERADFVILLFAAFWLCFNSGGCVGGSVLRPLWSVSVGGRIDWTIERLLKSNTHKSITTQGL